MALWGHTGTACAVPPLCTYSRDHGLRLPPLCSVDGPAVQQNKKMKGKGEASRGPVTWGKRLLGGRGVPPGPPAVNTEELENAHGARTTASGMQDVFRRLACGC